MSHSFFMFTLLYGLSFLPWILSFFTRNYDTQLGLLIIDGTLTVTAYVFLAMAIGWWIVPIIIAQFGVGKVLDSMGIRGYSEYFKRSTRYVESRRRHYGL